MAVIVRKLACGISSMMKVCQIFLYEVNMRTIVNEANDAIGR